MQMQSLNEQVEPGDIVSIGRDAEVSFSAYPSGRYYVVVLNAAWPKDSETAEYEVRITRLEGGQFEAADSAAHTHVIELGRHESLYIELIGVTE